MNEAIKLEVCVDSVESAVAAELGGAHRVELCSSLHDGGVTPSSGLTVAVRQKISIGLHVMIRPRSADFCYSDDEFQIMRRDILTAKQLGADAVVFGILDLDGKIDVVRTKKLVKIAAPLKVTFHRAFDMTSDPFSAFRDLQRAGVHRVLTSGGKQTALEGAGTLKQLVAAAPDDITVMAGSGIKDDNVAMLIEQTGVHEIHASLRSAVQSPMRFRNDKISMGAEPGREYQLYVVDARKVQDLLVAASNGKRRA